MINKRILEVIEKFEGYESDNRTKFALKVGTSTSLVSYWISGKRTPGVNFRHKICTAYNISRDWLDTGNGAMMADHTDNSHGGNALSGPGAPQAGQGEQRGGESAETITELKNALIEAKTEARIYKEIHEQYLARIESALIKCSEAHRQPERPKNTVDNSDNLQVLDEKQKIT